MVFVCGHWLCLVQDIKHYPDLMKRPLPDLLLTNKAVSTFVIFSSFFQYFVGSFVNLNAQIGKCFNKADRWARPSFSKSHLGHLHRWSSPLTVSMRYCASAKELTRKPENRQKLSFISSKNTNCCDYLFFNGRYHNSLIRVMDFTWKFQ